jgi:hypothetical protein
MSQAVILDLNLLEVRNNIVNEDEDYDEDDYDEDDYDD